MQVLWSSSCLDSLLFSVHDNAPSMVVNDPAWTAAVRSLYQKVVREWIYISLSYAPCTIQGLLQVSFFTPGYIFMNTLIREPCCNQILLSGSALLHPCSASKSLLKL